MKLKSIIGTGLFAGALAISSVAGAAVTFDAASGNGFVGKGDVQTAFAWNNKQLQQNLSGVTVSYKGETTTTTEYTWECSKPGVANTQEKHHTTIAKSSIKGVVAGVARDGKNQITGLKLTGWTGEPRTDEKTTEQGPDVDSCPSGGGWTLTVPAGDGATTEQTSGGLYVSYNEDKRQIG